MLFSFILLSILLFRFLTIQNYRLHGRGSCPGSSRIAASYVPCYSVNVKLDDGHLTFVAQQEVTALDAIHKAVLGKAACAGRVTEGVGTCISIHAPTWGATVKPSNGWLLGHKDNEFANENIIIINSVNIT